MAKTRGAHSFRPRVCQGPIPPAAGPSAVSPAASGPVTTGPSAAAASASPSVPAVRPLLLVMLRVPPLWPLPRGEIILGSGPLHPGLRIPGQPRGPHQPREPGHQAKGSHLLRDLGRHPLHLIRVLPELQIYLRHPSSGGLTSPVTPS